jgi:hypothetical protein
MAEMPNTFVSKLRKVLNTQHSSIVLMLSPKLDQMPLPLQRYDEPLLPFGKAIIDATHDAVCGYAFDLEAYLVPGAAGIIALERTINYVPENVLTILHGTFFTPAALSIMSKTGLNVDAITVGQSKLISQQPAEIQSRMLLANVDDQATGFNCFSLETGAIMVNGGADNTIQLRLVEYQALRTNQGGDFAESARAALVSIAAHL